MEIGTEDEPYIAEPIEDPFRRQQPEPEREAPALPLPTPATEPVKTPAGT